MKDRKDRTAFVTIIIGVILMILTIMFRVNPAEGSIVHPFLTQTFLGRGILLFLLISCMPAWILAVFIAAMPPLNYLMNREQWVIACTLMLIIQTIVYWGVGKFISFCIYKLYPELKVLFRVLFYGHAKGSTLAHDMSTPSTSVIPPRQDLLTRSLSDEEKKQ